MKLPLSKNENIVAQEADRELLIYDLVSNQAYCLNETSALVWQFSNGGNSIAEIADLMSQKLKTLVTEEIVWLALEQLKKDNLLENGKDFEIDYHGLTRRQVIQKIGLGSMIALPLIASVIAPSAAMAQSSASSVTCILNAPGCVPTGGRVTTIQPNEDACFGNPFLSPSPGSSGCCSCGWMFPGSLTAGNMCQLACS